MQPVLHKNDVMERIFLQQNKIVCKLHKLYRGPSMKKQKTCHEAIIYLMKTKGYSFRQLADATGFSPSKIHRIANDEHYQDSVHDRDLLNSLQFKEVPRWADRIKRGAK